MRQKNNKKITELKKRKLTKRNYLYNTELVFKY